MIGFNTLAYTTNWSCILEATNVHQHSKGSKQLSQRKLFSIMIWLKNTICSQRTAQDMASSERTIPLQAVQACIRSKINSRVLNSKYLYQFIKHNSLVSFRLRRITFKSPSHLLADECMHYITRCEVSSVPNSPNR